MQFDIKPINYELDFSLFDEQKEINSAAFNIYLFYFIVTFVSFQTFESILFICI